MSEKGREDKEGLKRIIYKEWEEFLRNYTPSEPNDSERAQFERMIHAEEMARKYIPNFRIGFGYSATA